MSEPAPFGRAGENPFLLLLVLMQRIIKAGDHSRGVAEGGVLGDVFDALAVNPDFSRPSSRLSRNSLPVYGRSAAAARSEAAIVSPPWSGALSQRPANLTSSATAIMPRRSGP